MDAAKKETMNKLINGYSYEEVPSGTGKKLSEDEWKGIVEHHYEYGGSKSRGILIAKDYISGRALFTATESGLSLLKSLNLLDKYERGEILILKEKK